VWVQLSLRITLIFTRHVSGLERSASSRIRVNGGGLALALSRDPASEETSLYRCRVIAWDGVYLMLYLIIWQQYRY